RLRRGRRDGDGVRPPRVPEPDATFRAGRRARPRLRPLRGAVPARLGRGGVPARAPADRVPRRLPVPRRVLSDPRGRLRAPVPVPLPRQAGAAGSGPTAARGGAPDALLAPLAEA